MPSATVQGRKVYYEIHGETLGTPLVLVMGLGGSCRGWIPFQVPDFSKQHRVLLFDNRGVGSSEDSGKPFTTADLADDVAGLMDALGIQRAHALGGFLGAMIVQELALRHPSRVERPVLVGTYARPDAKRRALLETWKALAESHLPLELWLRERMLWTLQDETFEQTDLIENMLRFYAQDGITPSSDVYARQCDACLTHDTHERLRKINAMTLVVCGRYDQLTPPKFHRELADEIPGARLITMAHGGHLVMAEWAQRFNELVLHFLAETRWES